MHMPKGSEMFRSQTAENDRQGLVAVCFARKHPRRTSVDRLV
jgi:hypothetical protein